MNKQNLAISILVVCLLCLVLGIFTPVKNKEENIKAKNSAVFSNINNVSGDRIALLNIEGVISADVEPASFWNTTFNTYYFIESLDKAAKDNKVKAILIRINSPGGTVAASQDIYDAVLRAREIKPIVVSMADVCASGGYYVASAADRIVAQKGTMTGSIGVIFNFMDIADLANKVGINSNVIKSGQFKDSGSMYRKITPAEKALFNSTVNMAYGQFINAIKSGRINRPKDLDKVAKRDLTEKTLKTYADGRVFLGEEAYKLGFVDSLGSMYEAKLLAEKLANKPNLPLASYNKMSGFKSMLMNMENKFNMPVKEMLPFSYLHSSQPLMIWEQ